MSKASRNALRFVRALLGGGVAVERQGAFELQAAGRSLRLSAGEVRVLLSDGVLAGSADRCAAGPATAQWLKRQMLEADAFAAQHRIEVPQADGTRLNLAESPLARLASAAPGEAPFLSRHQVEAGERVRRLVERAGLQPRLTMSYSAAHTAGGKGPGHAAEIGDLAADARRALNALYRALPHDCAEVVLDVCGFGKGLQLVEAERGWPRRSAKLVLRIGLDRLAEEYGLGEVARGAEVHRRRAWMDGARVAMFG